MPRTPHASRPTGHRVRVQPRSIGVPQVTSRGAGRTSASMCMATCSMAYVPTCTMMPLVAGLAIMMAMATGTSMPDRWGQHTPRGWHRVRRIVLQRDSHICMLHYAGCTEVATECHHIISVAALGISREDALDPDDCIAVCSACHRIETHKQARDARHAKRHRRTPPHPADHLNV